MPGPLTILHLSDFHFSRERAWDADPVLRDLVRQVRDDVSAGMGPDVVAFTGDIADRGRPSDYEAAGEWIRSRLLPSLPSGFPENRLLFVAGNHDVDREQVDEAADSLQARLLSSEDQQRIAKVLADGRQRDILLRRHRAYIDFVSSFRTSKLNEPWWSEVIELPDLRVHFAGLCSSWMSCGDDDRGHLLLSRFQINAVAAAGNADLSVALIHHPWSYFAEFDATESESAIHRQFHLLLRGHLHRTDSHAISYPDKECIELAAGAAYSGGDHPNAFQWITMRTLGQVEVAFRIWSDGRWIADRNQASRSPHGVATFSFRTLPAVEPLVSAVPFAGLVAELSAGFSGRQFLDRALDDWLEAHDRGYFIVEGEPGIGKTAWAAHLAQTRDSIHHFNIEAEGIVRVDQCQRALCTQLASRHLPGFEPNWSLGFADGELLRGILDKISARLLPGQRVLIVVDALDEAAQPTPGQNALCLPKNPPKGIHFVLTTRPLVDRALAVDVPAMRFVLGSDSVDNREDVLRHVQAFVSTHPLVHQRHAGRFPVARALAEEIANRSEGNFMYLRYVLPELECGDLSAENLPSGLAQYYQSHWQKMKSRDERKWGEHQAPVLAVLAASAEQISADDIRAFVERSRHTLGKPQVLSILNEWRPFLRVTQQDGSEHFYSIYHKSFRDFLKAKNEVGEIDLRTSHEGIASVLRETFDAWKSRLRGTNG